MAVTLIRTGALWAGVLYWLALPLLRPTRLLAALPLFGRNLVAAHPSRVWISSHYSTALTPAVPFAFVGTLARLPVRLATRLAIAARAATIAWNIHGLSALIGTEIPIQPPPDAADYRAALAQIPPGAPVAATPR